ncbi:MULTISPECIES: UDP-N-acetylmuramate--L-alanine ligase [unclassified Halorhodospira]|uniref:UDP-N-acetylmuramate--L-alanine ligase n=1 Tax=unclassified Halorhodospira TaxID=2626748 RepID=UPI001EE9AEA1|nr:MULTISPECIES: UDP-N-acetylmuramate--L-alanine ligase [unclassified Halorhodospira]MCG5541506.1 UDP-N-acetylmuramate--L-alanine ligase [Halorhodospira sp. M39old]MCG5546262.1 UDP-N-acetylmuramate--L-alanine ligase [Halorhodospira sp. M38]
MADAVPAREPRFAAPADGRGAFGRVRRIHFVGIGGAGMGGIAEVLHNLGFTITGSDVKSGAVVERLLGLGVAVRIGHDPGHVEGVDAVVVSTAVTEENPEVQAARQQRIPVVPRAEMLAELMRFRHGVAVAGTHGKTTTTSLLASCLAEGGLDPTFVIGGRLISAGAHARLGAGPYLVAEADESDASFLHLKPMMAAVTNVDADHLGTYGGDFDALRRTFIEFLHHLPFYGLAVLCIDEPEVRRLREEIGRPVLTYGFSADADVRVSALEADGHRTRFRVEEGGDAAFAVELSLPGRHNVLNATAAIALARELGVDVAAIQRALSGFQGIGRRFQVYPDIPLAGGAAALVDDYAHHPRELEATLEAARAAWPERRLVVVFQPHRYTRTRELFDDFARVLSGTDALVLTEVYAAGEARLPGADGRALASAVRDRGGAQPIFADSLDEVPGLLAGLLRDNDVVLTLGAGSIGGLPARLGAGPAAGGAA